MMDEIREYQSRVASAAQELERLQTENRELVGRVMSTNAIADSLTQRLSAAEAELESARANKLSRSSDLEGARKRCDDIRGEIAALLPRVEAAEQRGKDAERQARQHEEHQSDALSKLRTEAAQREGELQEQLDAERAKLAEMEAETTALRGVEEQLATLRAQARKLKSQLVHAKAYSLHKSLSQAIRDSRSKTGKLREIAKAVQSDRQAAVEQLRAAEKRRDRLRAEIRALKDFDPSAYASPAGIASEPVHGGSPPVRGSPSAEASPAPPARASPGGHGELSMESYAAPPPPPPDAVGAVSGEDWMAEVHDELARLKDEAKLLHEELEHGASAMSGADVEAAVLRAAAEASTPGTVPGSPGTPSAMFSGTDDLYNELADMNAKLQAELEHVATVQQKLTEPHGATSSEVLSRVASRSRT